MPEIRAFRGLRYDLARVGALADVIAPPYDVIDSTLQDALYDASPHNIIRLELNREQADDSASSNRYSRAARFLKEWQRDGILREDSQPALYLYHQTFEVEGTTHTRKGFLARVRLEPFGEGRIFPHEQTLAGPKADRLALFHATKTNLSPIFGLYPDPDNEVIRVAEAGVRDRTPLEAIDHLGVVNRLWEIHDPAVVSSLQGLMAPRPVYIADGHHRYETGLKYREEKEAAGTLTGPDDPAQFCMMMLVGMDDPGLLILPTHRLVRGFPNLDAATLTARLEPTFEVTPAGTGPEGCRAAWETIELHDDQDCLGFGTVADGQWVTARLRDTTLMDQLAAAQSPDWRSLGVSILHELVLKHLLREVGVAECTYVHQVSEVLDSVGQNGCDLACLVPPAAMVHVEAIASSGEKMPPKSTYFYPKLVSGLVLNPIG